MNSLPGSSWSNPIWYGKWRIYLHHRIGFNYPWEFVHDDYDGDTDDNRNGYAFSVDDAKHRIDHWDDE